MEVYKSYQQYNRKKGTVLTVGMFDGVHKGHQKILEKIVREAKHLDLESVVFTFSPHPRYVLEGGDSSSFKLLSSLVEKEKLLENLGVDCLVVQNFVDSFSNLSPEDYVKKVLVDALRVKKIIVGYDHRFGKNRAGTYQDLVRFGKTYGFEVEQVNAQEVKEITVSSTKIRKAIENGEMEKATILLGRPYSFEAKVIEGKKIGRTIGFPTANLALEDTKKMVPKKGAYVVDFYVDNAKYRGMMNIGNNPTLEGTTRSIEVFVIDFDKDIYRKKVRVEVLSFIRDERKFESIEALKQQLNIDKEFSEKFKL